MQLLNVLITCLQIASGAKEYLKQTLSLEHLLVSYFEILSLLWGQFVVHFEIKLEELLVVCVCLYAGNGATLLVGIWWLENKIEIMFCSLKAGREREIKPCAKRVLTKFHDILKKKWIPECDFWFPGWNEKWHNLIFSSQVRSWVLLHDRRVWVFR